MTVDAFFLPDGDAFTATALTRGPWDRRAQHAGPPAALLGQRIAEAVSVDGGLLARLTVEILRPVPIGRCAVGTEVLRPGRSVALAAGRLSVDGQDVMRASAWVIRTDDVGVAVPPEPAPSADPDDGVEGRFFPTGEEVGYHTAMQARFVTGGFTELGPATVWMRPRVPVVAGEPITPLQRVLVAADSGNGVSSAVDFTRYVFVNTDLTVHLHRLPAGEWVGMDARTVVEPHGVGLAQSRLFDEDGILGRSLQSLYVAAR